MSDQLYLKPAVTGAIVRDPLTAQPLAAEGEFKPRSTFWLRRLREGGVIEAPAPAAKRSKTSKPKE